MRKPDRNNPSKNKGLKAPRAPFHDYCAPGYYFITMSAHEGMPPLSEIICPRESLMHKGKMIIAALPATARLAIRLPKES